jgi:hypothetical protein
MSSASGSAAQFRHSSIEMGTWIEDQSEAFKKVPNVAPYMQGTGTSAERVTAWRMHRDGGSLPQPFSKRTSGSIYRWNEDQ